MTVKCVIACHNAAGAPDITFVKVRCSQAQNDEGEHYDAAEGWASDNGYESPFVVFDEDDAAQALLDLFVWASASTVTAKAGARRA